MLSRLQEHIKKAMEAMEKLVVRKAIHSILFELDQDLQWYQKRAKATKGSAAAHILRETLNAQIRMLVPFAPHICEELWEMMGEKGFASLSTLPTPDEAKVDVKAEENETLIMNLLEDTQNIVKATNIKPKKICYYTASPWKWKAYLKIIEKSIGLGAIQSNIIRELLQDTELKAKAKEVAEFANKTTEEVKRTSEERKQKLLKIGVFDENKALNEAKDFLKQELNAEIQVYCEEDQQRYDPKNRARTAKPYRPAIYIE
jgi:leucyl-tRNA synthetase